MGSIFNKLTSFLREDDWNFSQLEDKPMIILNFSGDNGTWRCFGQAREELDQLLFYSMSPLNVPEDKRASVMEFLTRANYGLVLGNFEMDLNDGEVRYKTSINASADKLDADIMKPMLYANLMTLDRYLPGLMAVLHGGVSAEEAVARVEG